MVTLENFYKSKDWEGLIAVIKQERIADDGFLYCEHCGKPILKAYDCIAHHKEELTEENVHDPYIALNPDNIILVHHRCHNIIHNKLGYAVRQIFLVYGSPLAGKTTWVNNAKEPGDLIVDITNKATNTKIFKLSDRTRNKEGRNIDFAVVDETHEMKDNVIGKSIEQSQSLKDNPKFINITTEGFVIDGYLDQELKKARAVINREDPDDPAGIRLLPWLYTQDSEQEVWNGDRRNRLWEKSNPTLGIVKKWDYLEQQVSEARKSKADRIFVLSKDFNIKQNAAESWLNLEDYDYENAFDPEEFRGSFCLGAVDLSETTDLCCAKALVMRPEDPVKYILTMYFIPESKLEDSDDWNAGARYKEWAEIGYLTITEGNDIDLARVADWFYWLYTEYDIRLWRAGYDQRFSKDWISQMDNYGWSKAAGDEGDLFLIQQNAQTLSNAMKLCEADLKHRLVNYNGNPVDKWNFKNSGIKVDSYGNAMCVKLETAKRIDGSVCLIILYETYRRNRTEFRQMIGGKDGLAK